MITWVVSYWVGQPIIGFRHHPQHCGLLYHNRIVCSITAMANTAATHARTRTRPCACDAWLAARTETAPEAPGYCRNAALFDALRDT